MRISKFALLVGFVVTVILFAEIAAHADEADQATKFTFNQPVQIPGQILPAGTYLFKVDADNQHLVRVFSADGIHLYATLQTISAERAKPTDDTVIVLADDGAGKSEALVKWFYPGNTIGTEFLYPKREEQRLAQDRQQAITTKETAEAGD